MTKRNLLLVSLLLVFGLCAMAPSLYAQGTVWSASSNQNTIRNEGDAEGVGTITLTTTSTGTIESNSGFTILYTLLVANNGAENGTSPPLYAVGVACTGPSATFLCATTNLSVTVPTVGVLPTTNIGKVVQLTFTNTTPTTIGGTNTISVAVRVIAQGVVAGTGISGTVSAFYKFGNQPLTLTTTTNTVVLSVGTVQGPATTITFEEGPEYVLTCIGVKDIQSTAYDNDFALNIAENWNDALTSMSDEYALENNDTNNRAGTLIYSVGPTYWPTNGSDILITFTGVPYNKTATGPGLGSVGIVGEKPIVCTPSTCPGGALWIDAPVHISPAKGYPYGASEWFWYKIEVTNVSVPEFANFPFKLWSKGPLPPNMGFEITATVWLTDLYPTDTKSNQEAGGEMPYFTLPELPTGIPVVYFMDCVTKMLFPYINTFGAGAPASAPPFSNFGTGIDIANTTLDPFALAYTTSPPCDPPNPLLSQPSSTQYCYPDEAAGSATPQYGSCTFYFYPMDESAAQVWITPSISAGGSYAFDVASVVPKFAGKTGYAIAICDFQNAHGFTEIYDNYANMGTHGPNTIIGYVPEILPEPAFYHRTPAGDGLGEGAIAPVDIEKHLLKLLMGIRH